MIKRIKAWFTTDLWADNLGSCKKTRALWIGPLRLITHAIRSFSKNLVGMQAAGLTMLTILGLVPVLWLGLGVAKSLGFDDTIRERVEDLKKSEDLPAGLQSAIESFQDALGRVSFQTLGIVGTLIFLYSAYSLFITIEKAFNHVWKTKRRAWYGRLGSFIGVVLIVPLFLLSAIIAESVLEEGSFVVYMREELPYLAYLYDAGIRFAPAIVVWIACTALFKLLPSAKVRWVPAATAGGLAATGLVVLHGLYVNLQLGLVLNNKVYAALAALPILIVYLSLMWTVVLAGVQVSYALQNLNNLGPPTPASEVEHGSHRHLALVLAHAVVQSDAPVALEEVAQELDVPREWIDDAAEDLVHAEILDMPDDNHVAPARASAEFTMWDVVRAVETRESDHEVPLPEEIQAQWLESREASRTVLGAIKLRKGS